MDPVPQPPQNVLDDLAACAEALGRAQERQQQADDDQAAAAAAADQAAASQTALADANAALANAYSRLIADEAAWLLQANPIPLIQRQQQARR